MDSVYLAADVLVRKGISDGDSLLVLVSHLQSPVAEVLPGRGEQDEVVAYADVIEARQIVVSIYAWAKVVGLQAVVPNWHLAKG